MAAGICVLVQEFHSRSTLSKVAFFYSEAFHDFKVLQFQHKTIKTRFAAEFCLIVFFKLSSPVMIEAVMQELQWHFPFFYVNLV